jgi:hypothetical protein
MPSICLVYGSVVALGGSLPQVGSLGELAEVKRLPKQPRVEGLLKSKSKGLGPSD